jgi:hypothetical protein
MQATNGAYYGTASGGGMSNPACIGGWVSDGCGTVFSLSVGLGPFVKTLTESGQEGTIIQILGNDLAGTTSVTFNGRAAAFTVHSNTFITATVPPGATTGRVEVMTPKGAVGSNVRFRVEP